MPWIPTDTHTCRHTHRHTHNNPLCHLFTRCVESSSGFLLGLCVIYIVHSLNNKFAMGGPFGRVSSVPKCSSSLLCSELWLSICFSLFLSISCSLSVCLSFGCAHDKSLQMPNKQIKNPKGATNAKTPFDVEDLLGRF